MTTDLRSLMNEYLALIDGTHENWHEYKATLRECAQWEIEPFVTWLEKRALDAPAPRPPCGPDDHMYSAIAGSPIGDGVCVFCGEKEPPESDDAPAECHHLPNQAAWCPKCNPVPRSAE